MVQVELRRQSSGDKIEVQLLVLVGVEVGTAVPFMKGLGVERLMYRLRDPPSGYLLCLTLDFVPHSRSLIGSCFYNISTS